MSTSTPGPTGTVVLCGSVTRAVDALNAAERHYLALGYRVHKPVADDTKTPDEHAERWYGLIDLADLVVICIGEDARVGEQTVREHYCAMRKGKTVKFWTLTEERAS